MVYRRRRFVRRARPARTRRVKTIARVARRVVMRMSELHRLTPVALTSSMGSISSTWHEIDLCDDIAMGGDLGQRIGRKIAVNSFYLDGVLQGGQTNLATDDRFNTVRFVLGLWRSRTPCTANSLTMSSMINKSGYGVTGGASLIRKFRDFKVILSTPGADSTGYLPAVRKVRIYVKFRRPITILFPASAATTTQSMFLILSVISDSVAIPNPGFTNGSFTLSWYDI